MSYIYLSNSFLLQNTKSISSTKRSASKSKINPLNHSHLLSPSSPFCSSCGSLYYLPESSSLVTSSIKPPNLYYTPEVPPYEFLSQMRTSIEEQEIPYVPTSYDTNIDGIRKKIITRMRNYTQKFKMSITTLYLAVYIMDMIILKDKVISQHKIEQIAIGAEIISMKYLDLYMNIAGIKQFQLSFEGASFYSCEQIRKFEISCIKKVSYKLNYVTFLNVIQFFLMNGIILSTDILNNSKPNMSIYFLIYQISDMIIENGIDYIQYDPFLLSCAILSLSRQVSKFDKWPNVFVQLYHISEEEFENEFSFVNEIYIKKTQMKVKIKITRNASCNISNNLNKLKNKGFFNSNNCNINYINNNKFLKKIFNSRKIVSRSMEMTRDISSIRYGSANSSHHPHNQNIVIPSGKGSISRVNVRLCHKGDISTSVDNKKRKKRNSSSNKSRTSNKKKSKAQSKDNKEISINLSYRTITETCPFSKGKNKSSSKAHHIDEYKNKITNNIKINNISSVDSGKSKKNSVPNPYLFSKSFNNKNKNRNKGKNTSHEENSDKKNHNIKNVDTMKKNILRRKSIDIIDELTMNKLNLLAKLPNESKRIKRQSSFSSQKIQNGNNNYALRQKRKISEILLVKKNAKDVVI